jgi:hypothetical protein
MAVNLAGSSMLSAESDFIVAAEVPEQPTNVVNMHSSSSFITIGWSAPLYNGGTTITSY